MPAPDKTELLEFQIKTLNEKLIATEKNFDEKIEAQEKHMAATDAGLKALVDQRNNFLIWGILALGSGLVGSGTFIFNLFFTGHPK
jgi:hypothetical protein